MDDGQHYKSLKLVGNNEGWGVLRFDIKEVIFSLWWTGSFRKALSLNGSWKNLIFNQILDEIKYV